MTYKYHQRYIFESFKLLQQSFNTVLRVGKLEDQRIFHCLAPVFCKWMWIFHSKHRFNKPVPNMFWPLRSVHIQLLTSALSPENPQQFRHTPRTKLTKQSQKQGTATCSCWQQGKPSGVKSQHPVITAPPLPAQPSGSELCFYLWKQREGERSWFSQEDGQVKKKKKGSAIAAVSLGCAALSYPEV